MKLFKRENQNNNNKKLSLLNYIIDYYYTSNIILLYQINLYHVLTFELNNSCSFVFLCILEMQKLNEIP